MTRNAVRSWGFARVDPGKLVGDRDSTWSSGGGDVFCTGVLLSVSNRTKLFRLFSRVTVTGLWSRFIVCDGLYPLPQSPCVSAVSKVMLSCGCTASLLFWCHGTSWLLLMSDQPHPATKYDYLNEFVKDKSQEWYILNLNVNRLCITHNKSCLESKWGWHNLKSCPL